MAVFFAHAAAGSARTLRAVFTQLIGRRASGPAMAAEKSKEDASRAFRAGNMDEALRLYADAAGQFAADSPREAAACFANMAHIHGLGGRWDAALESSTRAVAADPSWGKGHFRHGEALFAQQQYDAAIASFESARAAPAPEARAEHLIKLSREAQHGGIFFRQILSGREVCTHARNMVQQKIFSVAEQMQNFMYLIGDAHSREVVVVDACWDVEGVMKYAEEERVKIIAGVATHYHFDHVGGTPPAPFSAMGIVIDGAATLAAKGLPIHVNKNDAEAVATKGKVPAESISKTEHRTILQVGQATLQLLHTPGHTPGSQCVYCGAAKLVLTGDTLFIGSCGRLDLPDCDKAAMHRSLQETLANLPPDTKVYPGHNYGGPYSTIQQEREKGLLAPMSLSQWLTMM